MGVMRRHSNTGGGRSCSFIKLTLDDLLSDELVLALMASDEVNPLWLNSLLRRIAQKTEGG